MHSSRIVFHDQVLYEPVCWMIATTAFIGGKAAGAHDVIIYTETDFAAEVKAITGGSEVDMILDSVGKTT